MKAIYPDATYFIKVGPVVIVLYGPVDRERIEKETRIAEWRARMLS